MDRILEFNIGDLVIFTKFIPSGDYVDFKGTIIYISYKLHYYRVKYEIEGVMNTCNLFDRDEIKLDIPSTRELEINKLIK